MARRTRQELEAIVRQQAAGFRLAEEAPPTDRWSDRSPAEAFTPDLATLHHKYLGGSDNPGPADSLGRNEAAHNSDGYDEEIVAVIPDTDDPWDRAARPKSVVISSEGEIIGSQG